MCLGIIVVMFATAVCVKSVPLWLVLSILAVYYIFWTIGLIKVYKSEANAQLATDFWMLNLPPLFFALVMLV